MVAIGGGTIVEDGVTSPKKREKGPRDLGLTWEEHKEEEGMEVD